MTAEEPIGQPNSRPTSPANSRPNSRPDVHDRVGLGADLRVSAVLDVLGGLPVAQVAVRSAIDPDLLERWVRDFVATGAAQVTNQPVTKLAQQRDRFLATYAHETRTPLGAAIGWAAMLRDEELSPELRARTTDRLCAALDRLAGRIDEIQLLAASSLGRLVLDLEPVDAVDLVVRLGYDAEVVVTPGEEPTTEDGGLLVDVDVPRFSRILRDVWAVATADPAPRRVWWEVVAVDPWVEIRARREAEPIEVSVLQALFEPFDRNDDGTGVTMGLYLARALAVAHGGTIGVDQNDTSAALWVRIPGRRRPGDTDDTGATRSA